MSLAAAGCNIPVLCIQEHFLLKGNLFKIDKAFPNCHTICKPAVKETIDRGRARNGMAVILPENFKNIITDVSPHYWRVQAVVVSCHKSKMLLINSYFPIDNQQVKGTDCGELLETLETIRNIIRNTHFDSLILLGDLNADFIRNSYHCSQIRRFSQELDLSLAWERFDVDFTYSQEVNQMPRFAILDHFLWNTDLDNQILDAGVVHCPDNTSDHEAIYCIVDGKVEAAFVDNNPKDVTPKPKWNLASEFEKESFQNCLNAHLAAVEIPHNVLNCDDVQCKDDLHIKEIDNFVIQILDIVDRTANSTLPLKGPRQVGKKSKTKCKPGWSQLVAPFRDKAYFWHNVWLSAGKPINCNLHSIMKKSRNLYHFQVRKIKKSENLIKKNKLLDACLKGNQNIFKEIKKLRNVEPKIANSIEGVHENINEHFRSIYAKLYNSVNEGTEMAYLSKAINEKVSQIHLNDVKKVTTSVIREAAAKLSNGKTDPVYSYSSDCFIHGPEKLFELLATVFRSFLIHGHFTIFLLLATLIPIIKDKLGSINSSRNYRSIAISSLTLKIFDWLLLDLFGASLGLDELQYAYQSGCSTVMCTWSVLETISYFARNGSDVYVCCMDMSKAFDTVRHSILFRKLMKVGISSIFLRLLIFIYVNQYANVKWNGTYSSMFTLSNGVRQGGVISALLYCFYGNELFEILRNSGYGCWLNGSFHGIFGYSDDNLLMAPSLYALQQMLYLCEKFAGEHNLKFSTDMDPSKCKTKCTAFLRKPSNVGDVWLCGNKLPWVNQFKHLGNTISNVFPYSEQDVLVKRAQFISKSIELNQEFYFACSRTKVEINRIYNSHFYGSQLWDLVGKSVLTFESSYNQGIKTMFDLPIETHRNLIEPISGHSHMRKTLISRFLGFIGQIRASKKTVPRLLLSQISHDVRSVTGKNMRNILLQTDKYDVDELKKSDVSGIKYFPIDPEDRWKASLVIEVIDARDSKLHLNGFSDEEMSSLIQFICTS